MAAVDAQMKCSRTYAREWWEQTASLLVQRYGWKATSPHRVETGGWRVSSEAAIANMAEAVQYELEDPEADPTLPLGEVLALVPLVDEEDYLVEVEVPNTPEAAADLIDQAVSRLGLGPGIVDEEFARTARLDHMGYR